MYFSPRCCERCEREVKVRSANLLFLCQCQRGDNGGGRGEEKGGEKSHFSHQEILEESSKRNSNLCRFFFFTLPFFALCFFWFHHLSRFLSSVLTSFMLRCFLSSPPLSHYSPFTYYFSSAVTTHLLPPFPSLHYCFFV